MFFSTDRKSLILEVWAVQGPGNHPKKGRGLRRPTCSKGSPADRGRPDPQTSAMSGLSNNHAGKALVCFVCSPPVLDVFGLSPCSASTWLPEGSMAGFSIRRHVALESACGANLSCKLMCGAGPGCHRGPDLAEDPGKAGPTISGKTAFKYPANGVSNQMSYRLLRPPPAPQKT